MTQSVAELRQALKDAEEAERESRKQRMLATPIHYHYEVRPYEGSGHFDKLYDSSCRLYTISRMTLNEEEARAAGHPSYETDGGSMKYIHNKQTGLIVCSVGGGTAFIGPAWRKDDAGQDADVLAFRRIGEFLVNFPEGGNITHIVNRYLADRRGN